MSADELNDNMQMSGDGSDATGDATGGGDSAFVSGAESKPMNRTTLYLIGFILLGGGTLYLMHLRTGPKAADAAPQAAQANQTITQFLSGGDNSIKGVEKLLKNTQQMVQQFLTNPNVHQVPLNHLQTNPFRQTSAKEGESNSEADARRHHEEEKATIQRAAEGLQVQSILSGSRKACMINNMMVTENQQIEGFVIEKINPHSVIVKQGEYRFELKMQK
jgi:hypothetical protein